jgi:hypothetical protein
MAGESAKQKAEREVGRTQEVRKPNNPQTRHDRPGVQQSGRPTGHRWQEERSRRDSDRRTNKPHD